MEPIKNTLEIECLVQSLQEVIEARAEHDNARDAYEGYSWGYHGYSYIKSMEDAADNFGTRLIALIDARVDAKLAAKP